MLQISFVHLELQIQFPSLPQYVAATVMSFMVTFQGTYLLFPAAYLVFYVCSSLIQRNWNHFENVEGFFSCVYHVSSSLFYFQYTMFISLFKDFGC